MLGNFALFYRHLIFLNEYFLKDIYFKNSINVTNRLDRRFSCQLRRDIKTFTISSNSVDRSQNQETERHGDWLQS